MDRIIIGKDYKPIGRSPSIILINPKYSRNVGAVLRASSCFGIQQVWFTGGRVMDEIDSQKYKRLPREERMRGYGDVDLINFDYPFEQFAPNVTPVAIELRPNSEPLTEFEHPENAVYVFGPEDGSLDRVTLQLCHRFVVIPSRHCLNLAAAVYVTLYDRMLKSGVRPSLSENRFDCGLEVIG